MIPLRDTVFFNETDTLIASKFNRNLETPPL